MSAAAGGVAATAEEPERRAEQPEGPDEGSAKRRRTAGHAEGASGGSRSPSSSSSAGSPAGSAERAARAVRAGEQRAKAAAERVPFSLEVLEAELKSLRAAPPPYVTDIGQLAVPSAVCDEDGDVKALSSSSEGPWDLQVSVSGEEGDEAYGVPFKVVLRFDIDLWPMKLAVVRFRGVFHHALTDDSGGMLMPFYRALPRDARGACTVALMLQAVHTFLTDPLKSWKIPPEKAPRTFQDSLAAHRKMNRDRLAIIRKYASQARHQELFKTPADWQDDWLDPAFLAAVRENTPEGWRKILTEHLPEEVYSFKLLTDKFCDTLVEEIFNFYGSELPARRPNSMNAYGIILNEIGLEPLIDELQRMLQPLGELLFSPAGCAWDGHHCFIVRYRAGEDLGLDMHTDDSDVTFNLCLGLDFAGAGLQFCGLMGAPNHRKHTHTYTHVKGSCVCHLGRKRHGADDISSGERLNLILWNHSSTYRQSDAYITPTYEAEVQKPDPICVSYTHDRDFGNFKEYPKGKEQFKGRGWCPRRTFEYPGFEADCDKELSDT